MLFKNRKFSLKDVTSKFLRSNPYSITNYKNAALINFENFDVIIVKPVFYLNLKKCKAVLHDQKSTTIFILPYIKFFWKIFQKMIEKNNNNLCYFFTYNQKNDPIFFDCRTVNSIGFITVNKIIFSINPEIIIFSENRAYVEGSLEDRLNKNHYLKNIYLEKKQDQISFKSVDCKAYWKQSFSNLSKKLYYSILKNLSSISLDKFP